jgi:hypothetical protein
MTSARKIRANRANARASSGPKTAAGKAQSAQNAFRHGFNVPIWLDPDLASDVEAPVQRIVGKGADANVLEPARRVAERFRPRRPSLRQSSRRERASARASKVPRPTTAAGSLAPTRSRRTCRPVWRSSSRTSRRSIATSAAPCRGRTARPRRGSGALGRGGERRLRAIPWFVGTRPDPASNLELCKS